MAQLVARFVRNEEVGGSNPPGSTDVLSRDIVYERVAAQDFFVVWGVDVWRGVGEPGHR